MKHPELNIAYFVSQGDSISYSKTLGRAIGILRASLLGQIIWWTRVTAEKQKWDEADRHFRDGHWWIWNTNEEWAERLYCLKERTIGDILRDLEEMNLIFSRTDMNEMKIDRTKWYAPNEEAINAFVALWDEMGRPIRGENGIRGEIKKVMDEWDKVKDDFPMIPTSLQDGEGPDDSDDENQNKSSESTSDVDCNIRQTEHGTYVKRNKEDTSDVTPITNTTSSTQLNDSTSGDVDSSANAAQGNLGDSYAQLDDEEYAALRESNQADESQEPTKMIQTIRVVFPDMTFTKKQKKRMVKQVKEILADGSEHKYPYSMEQIIRDNAHFRQFVLMRCRAYERLWSDNNENPNPVNLITSLTNFSKEHEHESWQGWRVWYAAKRKSEGITASEEPEVEITGVKRSKPEVSATVTNNPDLVF